MAKHTHFLRLANFAIALSCVSLEVNGYLSVTLCSLFYFLLLFSPQVEGQHVFSPILYNVILCAKSS